MKKYVKPAIEFEGVEANDIILTSISVEEDGTATLGEVSGKKANASMSFEKLFTKESENTTMKIFPSSEVSHECI